jgi:acetoin utilization deacetylase AcuC-like enzyme
MGRMMLSAESFRAMTELLLAEADALCDGRLVACHEGGYAPTHAPFCALAIIETMAGLRTGVVDPLAERLATTPGHRLEPAQKAAIDRVAARVAKGG